MSQRKIERSTPLDCTVRVITPENIEFEYFLAGPFQRLPAFVFDFALRAFVFVGMLLLLGSLSAYLPMGGSLLMIVMLLLFFGLSWFYGVFFETRFSGRTPGKMVFKLRAIAVDGRPINATQAALRNLLRLGDMCIMLPLQTIDPELPAAYVIPTCLVGLVVMTLTRRQQRLGDLAAGTMVISEMRRTAPLHLLPDDLRAYGLAEQIPATFTAQGSLAQAVGLYVENRRRLGVARRHDVARHLAMPLLRKFELPADTSYDLLLVALYVRLFLSADEQARGREQLRAQGATHLRVPPPMAVASRL